MNLNDLIANYTDRAALANALNCSERSIARYEKRGLPSLMIGGRKLYHLEAVAKWLKTLEEE